jgi:hypothetical protein
MELVKFFNLFYSGRVFEIRMKHFRATHINIQHGDGKLKFVSTYDENVNILLLRVITGLTCILCCKESLLEVRLLDIFYLTVSNSSETLIVGV